MFDFFLPSLPLSFFQACNFDHTLWTELKIYRLSFLRERVCAKHAQVIARQVNYFTNFQFCTLSGALSFKKNKNIQISKDYGEIFGVFEDMIT